MLRVGGIVLCGGRSSRMSRPKAWLPFGDEVMLQRVVRLLGTVVSPVVVVAAPDQELPSLPSEARKVRDATEGRGPLQGLAGGLSALSGDVEAAFVSSCDVPFLQPAFVRRMIELLADNQVCVPDVGGYRHPLAAVYRLSVVPTVERLLAEDRLRPMFLFQEVPTRFVRPEELAEADPTGQSLRNLNTPEEYAAALHDATITGALQSDESGVQSAE